MKKGRYQVGLAIIVGAFLLFFSPALFVLHVSVDNFRERFMSDDNLMIPVLRSFIFAAVASTVIVGLALYISLKLSQMSLSYKRSSILGVLLIPAVLGNLSTAFIGKLLLKNGLVLSFMSKFTLLTLMNFWQFGTLFIYLFWLNQQSIPSAKQDYGVSVRLSLWEQVRDIILPQQRNLAILCYLLVYIFNFYEQAKLDLIFKASRGTHTELITQWLNRNYQSNSLINAEFGFSQLSQNGLIVLFLGIAGLLLLVYAGLNLYQVMLNRREKEVIVGPKIRKPPLRTTFLLALLVIVPLGYIMLTQPISGDSNVSALLAPVLLTLLTAAIATSIATLFAVLARLIWREQLATFNRFSSTAILILLALQMIPELLSLICGFQWMQLIGYSSSGKVIAAWITAHVILSFPLLTAFAMVMHFSVPMGHQAYLETHQVSFFEKLADLFIQPLAIEYLLVLILAFSTIWNESTINSILSDSIPSFASELNKAISGKAVDYRTGMLYLVVSMAIATLAFILWDRIIAKARKTIVST